MPPPFGTPEFGGGDLTEPIPTPAVRDWAVLEAIRDVLEATGEFDEVAVGAEPEEQGVAASAGKLAVVGPGDWDEEDDADGNDDPDAGDDARNVVRMRFTLTLSVRGDDVVGRGRELDRLVGVCKNALNGRQILPDATVPGWTKLRRGRWDRPKAPGWSQTIVGETAYFVDGNDLHSTDEF